MLGCGFAQAFLVFVLVLLDCGYAQASLVFVLPMKFWVSPMKFWVCLMKFWVSPLKFWVSPMKFWLCPISICIDCKWGPHVNQLVKSANKKMWFLRRLKILGASTDTLVDIYKLFVRQGMEIASPAWSSGLTRGNITQLEQVQSQATQVICGWTPLNSEQRLNKLSLQDLKSRRLQLTKKFSIQFSADSRF